MKKRILIFHDNLIVETMKELAQERGLKIVTNPKDLVLGHMDWDNVLCDLRGEDFEAQFQVQQMPGCCAILTLSYIQTHPYTQKNIDYAIQFVEEAAEAAGFGSVVMTQVVPVFTKSLWKQEPWILALKRNWQPSDPFRNAKSGNLCVYLTKDLKQPAKRQGLERLVEGGV